MDWLHTLTTISSLAGFLWIIMIYFHKDTDKRIERAEVNAQKQIDRLDANMQKQAERSDRLYEMFIDQLKAQKKK